MVKMSAPNKAKPNVKASGENIFPSTFWKLNIGRRAVMIISFEKKTDFALLRAVIRIRPDFPYLLNAAIPKYLALSLSATKIASTMTTAPSMIIPKSIAPIDSRLALMPVICRHIKANRRASGMTLATIIVVRQSFIKRNTTSVTNRMPSITL